MSGIIQKLGAEKVKHHLEIDIHYIRAKLSDNCNVSIEVQRGKNMHKETQAMAYSTSTGYVQFDYPIGFDITMHKKANKYVKKTFIIKLYQIDGKTKTNNGKVTIDFSQIPLLNKPIVRREIFIQNCTDKGAVICISVKLEQLSKSRNTITGNLSPNSSLLSPNSSLVVPEKKDHKRNGEKSEEIDRKSIGDPLTVNKTSKITESPKKKKISKEPKRIPIEITEDIDSPVYIEERVDSDSKMSFSDFIILPKDSELSSESSSSEEEAKELAPERLIAHAMPKATREEATPNENSKGAQLANLEEKNGITTKREGNCCASCNIY